MTVIQGGALRAWRRARGWDVPEMARRIRQASGSDPTLPAHDSLLRMIHRWEREGLNTSSRAQRYELFYAGALGISPAVLAVGPAGSGVSSILSAEGSSEDGEDGEDPLKRREFGIAALGVLAGAVVPQRKVPASVSMAHVTELRQAAAQLCGTEMHVGGLTLLQEATALYSRARGMLDSSSYTSAVGAGLQSAAAELGTQAGFIAFDSAQHGLARTLLTEAAMLATVADDALITARSYSHLALQSSHLAALKGDSRTGLAREALRFLDLAAGAARREASPKVHAIIAMRRARAYGLLEDPREVRANITLARRELERGGHPADPGWTAFMSPAEVTAHMAMASLGLGQPGKAAVLYRDVLADHALPNRNRAIYRASLASALAAAGDRSQSVAEGMQVLPALEGTVRSPRTVNQLRPVRQQVANDSEFAVRFDAVAVALCRPWNSVASARKRRAVPGMS